MVKFVVILFIFLQCLDFTVFWFLSCLTFFGFLDGTGAHDDTGFLQNTGSTFLSTCSQVSETCVCLVMFALKQMQTFSLQHFDLGGWVICAGEKRGTNTSGS